MTLNRIKSPTVCNWIFILLLTTMLSLPKAGHAEGLESEVASPAVKPASLLLPFAFSTDATGFSVGVGGFRTGWPSAETIIGGAMFGSTQDSFGIVTAGRNLPTPLLANGRLYTDFDLSIGRYAQQSAYFAFRTPVWKPRPGSSGSSDDQLFRGTGWDHWVNLDLKYALPWGDGKTGSTGMFWPDSRQEVSQKTFRVGLNPLDFGRTWLGLRLSRRNLGFDPVPAGADTGNIATNNFQIFLKHDGTDRPMDPSSGIKWRIGLRADPGWADSYSSWNDFQAEGAGHIPLGESDWFSQRVLALGAWTGFSPSYQHIVYAGQSSVSHAPPFFTGSTLGGLFRMRAYASSRFNDKAGIYYSTEYRTTLRWNPASEFDLLKPMEIRWLQLAYFGELGNVAPSYNPGDLHDRMKYDVGIGLRMSIKGAIARIDYARAPHNSGLWFMIGQAF